MCLTLQGDDCGTGALGSPTTKYYVRRVTNSWPAHPRPPPYASSPARVTIERRPAGVAWAGRASGGAAVRLGMHATWLLEDEYVNTRDSPLLQFCPTRNVFGENGDLVIIRCGEGNFVSQCLTACARLCTLLPLARCPPLAHYFYCAHRTSSSCPEEGFRCSISCPPTGPGL